MVLESLTNPFKAEHRPATLVIFGVLFTTLSLFLSTIIFKSEASMVTVFLITLTLVPLFYKTMIVEETEDLEAPTESIALNHHIKALKFFMYLFIGMVAAFSFWYVILPGTTINNLYSTQIDTLITINGPNSIAKVTGNATSTLPLFFNILTNNIKVLIFSIIFSFLFGAGAIFIITWNASVIGTALGDLVRKTLTQHTAAGTTTLTTYFHTILIGILRYSIHGIPEVLSYFIGGLAGGIASVALVKHDINSPHFNNIMKDLALLLLLSAIILAISGFLEVWITPAVFNYIST